MSSISPIITFKAGQCVLDHTSKPYKANPDPRRGYVYLYAEDDLVHFCWRERSMPVDEPELDLVMVPTDGEFVAHESKYNPHPTSNTNGRIFVLKFNSSSQRYLFWLQSKPQGRSGDPTWMSPRDLKICELVHCLLQGEEVDVAGELASVTNNNDDSRRDDDDDDDDDEMEDVEHGGNPSDARGGSGSGGAGPGATGGDVREEGEGARGGGADGARAAAAGAPDAAAAVQNFLNSLQGGGGGGAAGQMGGGSRDKLYPALPDLLTTPTTVPVIRTASEEVIDNLLSFLPPQVLMLVQQGAAGGDGGASEAGSVEPSAAAVEAAKAALSLGQKKALVEKVLRSPQFHQSLGSLTMALRDGGLPSIAGALAVDVEGGGYVRGGSVPLGGGEAVEAFVEAVKKAVQKEKKGGRGGGA